MAFIRQTYQIRGYSSAASYQRLDVLGSIAATVVESAFDTFNLFTHYFDPSPPNLTTVSKFPVTVLSNYSAKTTPWFGPAGLVGLGPSSTLLRHLYDLNLVSSRSFGLYMGTAYDQSNGAINGSLTLGGYDSGRFEGEVYNFTIAEPNPDADRSPFKVLVTQITLDAGNGSKTELLDRFDAYITTSQYPLSLPLGVTKKLADITGASPSNDAEDVLRLPPDFDGILTITLEGGLNLTYDSEWLRNVSNNSPISASPLSSTSPDNNSSSTTKPNVLGSAFLSNVYFMANYDSHPPTFQLASALPHGLYVQTKTLCPDTLPVAAQTTNVSPFGRAGLTGAIVGGVIGGIGFSFACFWCFRRYMQRRIRRQAQAAAAASDHAALDGTNHVKGKSSSPSSLSEEERGSSEMTTFAFDFNSQSHQAYQTYLARQQQQQTKQGRSPPRHQRQSSTTSSAIRAQEYFRTVDEAYGGAAPMTPATGVPLLQAQQPPAETFTLSHVQTRTPTTGLYTPTAVLSMGEDASSSQLRRTSHEHARRQEFGLNVQTEFAPPPTSSTSTAVLSDRIARKAVRNNGSKKGSMLRRVFPPPPGP
ncbi:hypothetical protein LTS17_002463 [Exophiala oligosperma]